MKKKDWDSLVQSISQGNCILFLGPDAVSVDEGGHKVKPLTALSRVLVDNLDSDELVKDKDNLGHVAQIYHTQEGRAGLNKIVTDWWRDAKIADDSIYRKLTALPFKLYLTTTPDDSLLHVASQNRSRSFSHEWYSFRGDSDGSSEVTGHTMTPKFTAAEPLIYSLFGNHRQAASMVLSENDLLDCLIAIIRQQPPLPLNLMSTLASPEACYLFVGFGFQHWHWRLLLRVLRQAQHASNRSFAWDIEECQEYPGTGATASYFRLGHHMVIHWGNPGEFVDLLYQRFEESAGHGSVVGDAEGRMQGAIPAWCKGRKPVVFLSYTRGSSEEVMTLASQLRAAGIEPWVDVDSNRGGAKWHEAMKHVISEDSDYFVLCHSKKLSQKPESYVFEELDLALGRAKRFRPPLSYFIPIRLDDAPLLQKAKPYHHIDLFPSGGAQSLIREIQRDWQLRHRT